MNTSTSPAHLHQPQAGEQPNYAAELGRLRKHFDSDRTRDLQWRDAQLRAIGRMLAECEDDIHAALKQDLGKPELEAWVAETSFVQGEVDYARKHLKKWAGPRRVSTPMFALPGKSWIQAEPLGVALIMSAWNYPFQLIFAPLVAAIAAGNCAVLKPSELAPATSALVAKRWRATWTTTASRWSKARWRRPPLCCARTSTISSIPVAGRSGAS